MSSLLASLTNCFSARKYPPTYTIHEKSPLDFVTSTTTKTPQSDIEIATKILTILFDAEHNSEYQLNIQTVVWESDWTENIAARVLNGLQKALEDGVVMGGVLKEAFDKAVLEGTDFAREHPVYFTIIALGILVVLLPWVIETLGFWAGFGELGPIEGSWAALWQSRYAGYVPKGSLFAFFQRMGMVWK